MAEVDTSSYLKPSLPAQKSLVEQVQGYGSLQQQKQQIESGGLVIDKQKLDLMNTQFGLINSELSAMSDNPNITKDQAAERLQRFATTYKLPPEAVNHMMQELKEAPDVKTFSDNALRRGMTVQEKLNRQYGTPSATTDNQNVYQGVTSSPAAGGGFRPATVMPVQLPPTTEGLDTRRTLPNGQPNPDYLSKGPIGASGPVGPRPVLPVQGAATPIAQGSNTSLPIAPSPSAGGNQPLVPSADNRVPTFNDRYGASFAGNNGKVVSTPAPGVAEAIQTVGAQSGKDYALDLSKAKNFKSDLYPAVTALEGIKELGPQGVGPGTEALNNLKSAIITWGRPNIDPKLVEGVGTFEQTRKYLTQIARASGSTGTNDQLAAAFEANPSIKMSQAATENVLKSVIALRKMQHAQTLLFGKQGLPESQYSKWIAENQNILDPRAFGFDIMDPKAKANLMRSMAHQDKSGNWIANKGKEKEFNKFESSLQFANDADLISPPGRN